MSLSLTILFVSLVQSASAARVQNDNQHGAVGSSLQSCSQGMQPFLASLDISSLFAAGKGLSGGWMPTTAAHLYKFAKAAGKVPVHPDFSFLEWGQIISARTYSYEKKRLKAVGKVTANSTEVRTCDLGQTTLKLIVRSDSLLYHAKSKAEGACDSLSLSELQRAAEQSIEETCFNSCADALVQVAETSAPNSTPDTFGDLAFGLENIREVRNTNKQCEQLAYDSLTELADFALRKLSFKFPPRSPLWETDDKSPGDLSQKGPDAVCQMENDDKFSKVFKQVGICPSGSKCKCPKQKVYGNRRLTANQLRDSGNIFAKSDMFASAVVDAAWIATYSLFVPLPFAAAMVGGAALLDAGVQYATFQCRNSLGCWPQTSIDRFEKSCRMPAKVAEGGSPMWFLPPAGTVLKHQLKGCMVTSCKKTDFTHHKIGFFAATDNKTYPGRPHVYNCQALAYEEMNAEEQAEFVSIVENTDLDKEYSYPTKFGSDPSPK